MGYVANRGMGAAYINGVMIPSTYDPVGTPIVMNPAPGQNLQIVPTQYTGPQGGYGCNTAGGYTLRRPPCWLTDQCMTDSDYAAATAACAGAVVLTANDPIILAPNTAPSSIPPQNLYLNPSTIGIPSNPNAPIAPPQILTSPTPLPYAPIPVSQTTPSSPYTTGGNPSPYTTGGASPSPYTAGTPGAGSASSLVAPLLPPLQGSSTSGSGVLDSLMAWVTANPLLAGGIGLGAVFLLGGRR